MCRQKRHFPSIAVFLQERKSSSQERDFAEHHDAPQEDRKLLEMQANTNEHRLSEMPQRLTEMPHESKQAQRKPRQVRSYSRQLRQGSMFSSDAVRFGGLSSVGSVAVCLFCIFCCSFCRLVGESVRLCSFVMCCGFQNEYVVVGGRFCIARRCC